MLRVDWFELRRHRQIQFDAVASFPLAMNSRKTSWSYRSLLTAAVYRNRGPCRPRWYPKTQGKIPCLCSRHIKLHNVVKRVQAFLRQPHLGAILCPSQRGWDVQVHVYALRIAEVGVDAIVGCYLGHRARAARPAMFRVHFTSLEVVVRVIEGPAVGA